MYRLFLFLLFIPTLNPDLHILLDPNSDLLDTILFNHQVDRITCGRLFFSHEVSDRYTQSFCYSGQVERVERYLAFLPPVDRVPSNSYSFSEPDGVFVDLSEPDSNSVADLGGEFVILAFDAWNVWAWVVGR